MKIVYIVLFFNKKIFKKMPKITDKIKNIRKKKGITQQFLAAKLGFTQSGYAAIERGERNLTFELLERIALIFEMDVCEIINFHSNSQPETASIVAERQEVYEQNAKKPLKYTVENQNNEIIIRVILEKD